MKKIVNQLLTVSFITLSFSACTKDNESLTTVENSTSGEFKFKGNEITHKYSNVPIKALLYDSIDYVNLMRNDLKSSAISEISLDLLGCIEEENLKHYPDFDRLNSEDIEWIKRDFPTLNEEEIVERIDDIAEYYEQCLRYEMCIDIAAYTADSSINTSSANLKAGSNYEYGGDAWNNLSSEEKWFFVKHPKAAGNIKAAGNKATTLADSYYIKGGYQDKKDAFRHIIWNVLIARNYGEAKRHKDKGIAMAEKFTNLHESSHSAEDFDHQMDYHNNKIGRDYYDSVGVQHKKKRTFWFTKYWVTSPSTTVMAEYCYNLVENYAVGVDKTVNAVNSVRINLPVYFK